ncbi:DEAD/DEAH box helicase, partial [Bradyrhizobium sp. CCH5-F6]|uniref:DEAD/DEAH box helicase n=1 Tax=Bradyrhizobium sp. CCH5-F6 TaxID=1768753 RepID=UPI000769ACDF
IRVMDSTHFWRKYRGSGQWLQVDLGAKTFDGTHPKASRLIRAAAILACSNKLEHRRAAYRVATSLYELCGSSELPLDQGLRVVLARLGNFPAFGTRPDVDGALVRLPTALAIEEVASASAREVNVNGSTVHLTDFQYQLWGSLQRKDRVALAAPTSAGKSFVLEGYLASLFASEAPQSIIYLVPTRALITQVSEDLSESFKASGHEQPEILTIPIDSGTALPERAIYVMTQERAQILMINHPSFAAELIVVDEAHSIADTSRGILLQWVIDDLLERNETAQILFASPNVKNLDVFGKLFGLKDVVPFSSTEPTVAQNFLLASIDSAIDGRVHISTVGDGSRQPSFVSNFNLGQTTANRIEQLVHFAATLGKGHSNIVYANGAADAEDIALQLADLFSERKQTPARIALSELAGEAVHQNYALVECAKVGVAFHYSNIPTHLRRAIEVAVSTGEVDYLVCTSTLLQGVNLPAKNIFMSYPTKGKTNALDSTDFWNLAGRAGRLRREFQGNIFLIEYDKWKKKPLESSKETLILPAIETNVKDLSGQLVSVIRDDVEARSDRTNLESTFVRLFSDHKEGRLTTTLQRIGISSDAPRAKELQEALDAADLSVSLPTRILRNAPSISAHKQQKMFDELFGIASQGKEAARGLIPKHPRESGAFDSYAKILERCHRIIRGIDTSRNLHRFHALMAVWWMEGKPLPLIVENQIERNRRTSARTNIRKTLELIETEIRFQAVRLFGCYTSLLVHTLEKADFPELVSSIPSIPVYLEIGASDKTMISFISLGLSRVAAMRLNTLSVRKDLDEKGALTWLRTRPLEALGLSPLLLKEVGAILAR